MRVRIIVLMTLVLSAAAVVPSLAAPGSAETLNVTAVRAPVAPDGTTAGAMTDFVLTFADRDPAVDGVGIQEGGAVEIALPDGFVDTGAGSNTVVILQGWPQSPIVPFPYTTEIDGNTIALTLTSDFLPGTAGPGPKQVHLILLGFRNPDRPGRYPVSVTIQPDPSSGEVLSGTADVRIIPRTRPSVNVVSLFSGPPGPPPPFFNPLYQTVGLGEAARGFGMYLWDKDSVPFVGVDLEMDNARHGRLVKHGRTVGHARIDAPRGATAALTTQGPSVEEIAFITGVPVGLLRVDFAPDPDVAGEYEVKLRMNGGNEQRIFVTVVE